jgi:hypothetical protein
MGETCGMRVEHRDLIRKREGRGLGVGRGIINMSFKEVAW